MKKIFILTTILITGIIFVILFRSGQSIDAIREVRGGIVDNIEVIDTIKTDNGIMIYSVGNVNDGKNNMYFVDMVSNSLTGYKWLGGGGHTSQDVPATNDFILSFQLLSEDQNINPTLLGVIKDLNIANIKVSTQSKSVDAIFYEVNDVEIFYVIPLNSNVSNSKDYRITITYKNDSSITHIISGNKLTKLEEGKPFYLNKKDLK
ncbi:hypothetical protein [Bacillus sp. 2205SS5-2]|uniref:hypothetical protein n=1 Tax=Bacillus sp. 2205SS5-2 TaxID=3109031 RepID=UPI003007218F